jgi:hypothetical protein
MGYLVVGSYRSMIWILRICDQHKWASFCDINVIRECGIKGISGLVVLANSCVLILFLLLWT